MSVLSCGFSTERENDFGTNHDRVYQMGLVANSLFTWDEAKRSFDTPESRRVMNESRDHGLVYKL